VYHAAICLNLSDDGHESGTVMPSALAVLRLIVNLTFADSAMAAGISDRLWSLEELVEQTS
jgi:hypothetical protein